MKKVVKLTETDLERLVHRVIREAEHSNDRYMFFDNLAQIKRQAQMMLDLDEEVLYRILEDGHDWAQDHVAVAKENMDQIFDFFKNEIEGDGKDTYDDVMEGRKKTGTPLCARGIASAKSKYDVYPSAYANGHAVQVCKGKIKGLDGKRYASGAYR